MFPPLPQEKAANILKELVSLINERKVSLEQVSRISEERKNQPVMIGVLVCKDKNESEIALATNSGNAKLLKKCANLPQNLIFVPPIVSAQKIDAALLKNDKLIHELTDTIKKLKKDDQNSQTFSQIRQLNLQRKELCASSLQKVHSLYKFYCIDGSVKSLKEICLQYNKGKLPPTGTGDCCAPKLFDYAFKNNLQVLSLAEIIFSPNKFTLQAPCDTRCSIILPAMLGLRILYQDDYICVVNKQSGVLSVPGKTEDKKDCIESRFKRLFGKKVELPQCAVHRLDMETSGIMILAFTKEAHKNLNRQFEQKQVEKEYIALLDGILAKKGIAPHGTTELFFRVDLENRPHQIWDKINGKSAITEWQILDVERYHAPDGTTRNATRVLFKPHTGRTHQLRLVSADEHGFGTPIIGDSLYGVCAKGERLMLHAKKITFTHPATNKRITIECPPEF